MLHLGLLLPVYLMLDRRQVKQLAFNKLTLVGQQEQHVTLDLAVVVWLVPLLPGLRLVMQ